MPWRRALSGEVLGQRVAYINNAEAQGAVQWIYRSLDLQREVGGVKPPVDATANP